MKTATLIKPWKRPDHYIGHEWPDYFVFLGQNRDSDILTRSNFISGLSLIGGETETVFIVCESHWACGWIEWIAIHKSDTEALCKANDILERLEDYPVVNEDHWSQLEYDEVCDFWQNMSVRERADYCHKAGVSLFAARRDYLPSDDNGALFDMLRQ